MSQEFKFNFQVGKVKRIMPAEVAQDENAPEVLRGKVVEFELPESTEEMPDCISLVKVISPADAPLLPVPDGLSRCSVCGEYQGVMALKDVPDPEGHYRDENPDSPIRILCICDGVLCRRCHRNRFHKPGSRIWAERGGIAFIPEWRDSFPCDECNEKREALAAEVRRRKIAERQGRRLGPVPPWNSLSSADIQGAIDSEITRSRKRRSKRKVALEPPPSIRQALIDVFKGNEALRKEAEEKLEGQNPELILASFIEVQPKWAVRCSVTESMMSSVWGLKCICFESRGYAYFAPAFGVGDENECLPIVASWEPGNDRNAALAALKKTYLSCWEEFVLPPATGQWAKGSADFLPDAVAAVLDRHPSYWCKVLDRLRRDIEQECDLLSALSGRVAEVSNQEGTSVSAILQRFLTDTGAPVEGPELSDVETRVLVAAFVQVISMGGF